MTADRYQANIITKNPTDPAGPLETGAAPGVWSLEEANEFTKQGIWPTAGNTTVDVTEVFSSYQYTGNSATQSIVNNINLGQSYGSGGVEFYDGPYLDGNSSTAGLEFGSAAELAMDDFTIEGHVYIIAGSSVIPFACVGPYTTGVDIRLSATTGNAINTYVQTSSAVGGGTALSEGQWYHIAVVRSGTDLSQYVDGTRVANHTVSGSTLTAASGTVGGVTAGAFYNAHKYLSNFRISNIARYSGTSFTVPTANFTSDANTIVLTCQGSTPTIDNSSYGRTLTVDNGIGYIRSSTFGAFNAASAGEGGMVWIKQRTNAYGHYLYDTERGVGNGLASDSTSAQQTGRTGVTSFNSNGFSLGNFTYENGVSDKIASWTFRKAPKFFDVVGGLTSDSSGNLASFNHNLGSSPGMVILKATNSASNWVVYHHSAPSTYMYLNLQNTAAVSSGWATATDTTFTVNSGSLLVPSVDYVAYLFAHNNNDGGFGPEGDQDIIKCGIFTTDGSGYVPDVNLGFEPEFIILKQTNVINWWYMLDTTRSWSSYSSAYLGANSTAAEQEWGAPYFGTPTATGFKGNQSSGVNNGTFVYMAIRRGPLAPPTSGDQVFAMDTDANTIPMMTSGWTPDMSFLIATSANNNRFVSTRLNHTGRIQTDQVNSLVSQAEFGLEFTGAYSWSPNISDYLAWMWKRAPSFFDTVNYVGDGSASRSINHSLGVAPEMIWIKNRDSSYDWQAWHKDLLSGYHILVNSTGAQINTNSPGLGVVSATTFNVGSYVAVNGSGSNYSAFLFSSLAGVSKVGSYTGNGTSQTIDCGFTSGARYIVIKRTDNTGDWYVWDTNRGIVSGTESYVSLNTSLAPVATSDSIDPDSSGFIVNNTVININASGATYIFYAIA